MNFYYKILLSFFLLFKAGIAYSFENPRIDLGNFLINKYEITILEYENYSTQNNIKTQAEITGGGYEWFGGWKKRKNWNYLNPYGEKPKTKLEPAVHISRYEAENYCNYLNGRLPTYQEWSLAAYTQLLQGKNYKINKTYKFPSGDMPEKLNTQDSLNFNKHVDVTTLSDGINGLVAMGGNVWEWIDDQSGSDSLTAGGSWWYGSGKTTKDGAQYKPSDFYAIYVGFRCVFDKN